MYVHQTYKGPRGGRRRVEYFDELLAARLDVDDDGVVLRIRTADGNVNFSMDPDELQHLLKAFAHPVAPATLEFDFEVKLPTASEPTRSSASEDAPAPEVREPPTALERLLGDDPLDNPTLLIGGQL